jgi:hypothetical protein
MKGSVARSQTFVSGNPAFGYWPQKAVPLARPMLPTMQKGNGSTGIYTRANVAGAPMEKGGSVMKAVGKVACGALIASAAIVLAFAATARGKSLSQTTFTTSDLSGSFSFRLVPAESFAPFFNPVTCPSTPDAGVCTAPRQDILRVGVMTFDGAGNVSGHTLATTDNGQTTVVLDFNFTGTVTVNLDGTGTLSIAPSSGNTTIPGEGTVEGPETYSIVISKKSIANNRTTTVELAETDNDGGGAKIFLTGQAISR